MSSQLLKTAPLAILFGSLYTIFRKYQSVIELEAPQRHFNEPIFQSFIIFLGMSCICCFTKFIAKQEISDKKQARELLPDNKMIYLLPSVLDVLGTVVDTAGLFYTSVSVSQMLKGSVIFFTYLISIFYLKKSLSMKRHCFMLLVLISLTLIGMSNCNPEQKNSKFSSNPLLGNLLIIFSQLMFSLMFIYEQKILNNYQVKVQNAVFWEGIWGVIISASALIILSIFKTPIQTDVVKCCWLVCSNKSLLLAMVLTALCIAPFNYFGISLTKQGSALQRCLICTSRMIVVWGLSLVLGWEEFRFLQFFGYIMLIYAIYKFNEEEEEIIYRKEQQEDQKALNTQIIV